MARCVDTVLLPIPTDSLDAYRELATRVGEVWIEHGALSYFEGVSDEPKTNGSEDPGESFSGRLDTAETESIVFASIAFESADHRDEVRAAVMKDPTYREHVENDLPFDPQRMTRGSFSGIVDYQG